MIVIGNHSNDNDFNNGTDDSYGIVPRSKRETKKEEAEETTKRRSTVMMMAKDD